MPAAPEARSCDTASPNAWKGGGGGLTQCFCPAHKAVAAFSHSASGWRCRGTASRIGPCVGPQRASACRPTRSERESGSPTDRPAMRTGWPDRIAVLLLCLNRVRQEVGPDVQVPWRSPGARRTVINVGESSRSIYDQQREAPELGTR